VLSEERWHLEGKPDFDLVSIGYTAYDFLTVLPGLPEEDSKYEVDNLTIQGGGPAATAAVTARRLGLRVSFVGKVGDDYFGRMMLEELEREGVDVSCSVVEKGKTSQFAFIMINKSNASRTILWTRGDVSRLEAEEVNPGLVASSRVLLVDDLEPVAALKAASIARAEGVPVVIDAGSLREGVEELCRRCDYIVASEVFARQISRGGTIEEALEKIKSFGPREVVVTLGKRGCAALVDGEVVAFPGFDVDAVDTTGAGDVFHGAFAYGVLAGWDIERVCIFSNAVAALKCTRVGGRAGIPDFNEALSLISSKYPRLDFPPFSAD